jgi:NAD(P)-dependent dehydrogenase (short-subunit alcohol dehydrogenase family)
MGCRVIMVNRKEDQGEEAIKQIKEEVGEHAQIEWKQCDLGNLGMVKQVFSELAQSLDRLDQVRLTTSVVAAEWTMPRLTVQLILSSGINSNQFRLDHDGIDGHFGVNALGHYYAINLLYPLLAKTAKSAPKGGVRVVFESSEMHRFAPGSQDSKERQRGCHFGSEEEITEGGKALGPVELYGRTKLAMILYSKAIRDKVIEPNGDNIYMCVLVYSSIRNIPARRAAVLIRQHGRPPRCRQHRDAEPVGGCVPRHSGQSRQEHHPRHGPRSRAGRVLCSVCVAEQ